MQYAISSRIVGATKLAQLDDALAAFELTLCATELQVLTDACTPVRRLGLQR